MIIQDKEHLLPSFNHQPLRSLYYYYPIALYETVLPVELMAKRKTKKQQDPKEILSWYISFWQKWNEGGQIQSDLWGGHNWCWRYGGGHYRVVSLYVPSLYKVSLAAKYTREWERDSRQGPPPRFVVDFPLVSFPTCSRNTAFVNYVRMLHTHTDRHTRSCRFGWTKYPPIWRHGHSPPDLTMGSVLPLRFKNVVFSK